MTQGPVNGVPIDTDPTMALNSNQVVPSQAAVVTYVTAAVAGSGITTLSTNSGSATGGTVSIVGGTTGLTTSGSGSTVTLTGTLIVANGGTGIATTTANGVLCGGTTATGAFQNAGAGLAGQLLQSAGAAAKPVFTTATYPAVATGTGTILRADGTNWVATTATYPATTTSQQILYSTAANVVGQLTTANSAIAATNASGTLAMRALSTVIQVFTGSGTYTPTAGMLYCIIEAVGGGGAGGGAQATDGVNFTACGGGGAGEYARGVFSAATVGASQTVTIGAAGTANSGASGGNGGNTIVGSTLISANGGTGGVSPSTTTTQNSQDGSAGGTGGTGGSFRTPGQYGGSAFATNGTNASIRQSGFGGSSFFGSGGLQHILATTGSVAGTAGLGYGAGGGGALNYVSQSANSGGAGKAGIVVVTEYVIA